MARSTGAPSPRLVGIAIAGVALACGSDPKSTRIQDPPTPCLSSDDEGGSFRCSWPALVTDEEVDILFVIDDATVVPAARLAAAMDVFVDAVLEAEPDADLRIGVTTTDNGNPGCNKSLGEGGALDATSCRGREDDFASPEAFAAGCTDHCAIDDLALLPTTTSKDEQPGVRPWIEAGPHATNLPEGVSLAQALACVIPRGDRGCPLRAPAEVVVEAARRAARPSDPAYGFVRPRSRRIIVVVTAGLECSVNPEGASAFDPEGERTLWSDPEADAPTQAACWNAGVACEGTDDWQCEPIDRYDDGTEATVRRLSVLHPIDDLMVRIWDEWYSEWHPADDYRVFVLTGVPDDWSAGDPVPYGPPPDADLDLELGVAPICELDDTPVPPAVRMLSFDSGRDAVGSICSADYTEHALRLAALVDEVLPPMCMPACVADVDADEDGLQPNCLLEIEFVEDGTLQRQVVPLCMAGDVLPEDAHVCWSPRTDDDLDPVCMEEGWNLEVSLQWAGPRPTGSSVSASCARSDDPRRDCPGL
jgi:hypothetical protein